MENIVLRRMPIPLFCTPTPGIDYSKLFTRILYTVEILLLILNLFMLHINSSRNVTCFSLHYSIIYHLSY